MLAIPSRLFRVVRVIIVVRVLRVVYWVLILATKKMMHSIFKLFDKSSKIRNYEKTFGLDLVEF